MKLVSVSYAQSRLNFFRDQLAVANRRLDWSMKHNPDWYDKAEKGEVVSFYEQAVKMAEKEVLTMDEYIKWEVILLLQLWEVKRI